MFMTNDGTRVGKTRPINRDDLAVIACIPGVLAVARDEADRLVWCNDPYRSVFAADIPSLDLQGTHLSHLMSPMAAAERCETHRQVRLTGRPEIHYHLSGDRRMICVVMPLNPGSFGHDGVLVTICEAWALADKPSDDHPTLRTPTNLRLLPLLSRRELEVLYMAAHGRSAPEIAEAIYRSVKTVENHIASIHEKLGLHSKGELIRFCTERGLHAFTQEEWTSLVPRIGHAQHQPAPA